MRSAGLLAVLALAACSSAKAPQAEPAPMAVVTIPLKVAPGALSFAALGTEPFWSVRTSETELIYATPEIPAGVRIKAVWGFDSDGLEAMRGDQTFFWEGKLQSLPLRIEIKRGQCSDGMSDVVYSYRAKLKIGERTEQGCAKRQ